MLQLDVDATVPAILEGELVSELLPRALAEDLIAVDWTLVNLVADGVRDESVQVSEALLMTTDDVKGDVSQDGSRPGVSDWKTELGKGKPFDRLITAGSIVLVVCERDISVGVDHVSVPCVCDTIEAVLATEAGVLHKSPCLENLVDDRGASTDWAGIASANVVLCFVVVWNEGIVRPASLAALPSVVGGSLRRHYQHWYYRGQVLRTLTRHRRLRECKSCSSAE